MKSRLASMSVFDVIPPKNKQTFFDAPESKFSEDGKSGDPPVVTVFDVIPPKNKQTFFDAPESKFSEDAKSGDHPVVTGDERPSVSSSYRRSSFAHEYTTFLPPSSSVPMRPGAVARHRSEYTTFLPPSSAVPKRPGAVSRHRSEPVPSTTSSRGFSRMAPVFEEEDDFVTKACPIQKSMHGTGFHLACFALFAILMLSFHSMIATDPERSSQYAAHMAFVAIPIMAMIHEVYKMT